MRLIDADAYAFPGDLINEPTVDALIPPCKPWDKVWIIDTTLKENVKAGLSQR